MPVHVQAPDGTLVQFPDGMSDEQMSAAMRKEYGGADHRPKSMLQGAFEGVMKPIDNGAVAVEAGAKAIGIPTDKINAALHSRSAADVRQDRANAFANSPVQSAKSSKIAGEIVGTLPAALVTKNPFIAGAAQGALLSDAKTPGGVAIDAGAGAILNHFGGKLVDKAADFAKPVIDPAVKLLHDAGVKLTPGMVKGGKGMVAEDKAMSRPVVGDSIAADRAATLESLNTATVNRAVEPIGFKVPEGVRAGHDAVAAAHQAVSAAYDEVVPKLAVTLNNDAIAARILPTARNLPKPQQTQLRGILSNVIGEGNLSGQQLKNAQGEIRRLASAYGGSASASERELGRVLGLVDEDVTSAMLSQNPKWAPELQKVNKAFRGLAIVEDAAKRADDGVFNTGQLKQAVLRADKSRRQAASAQGEAFMQDFSNAARDVIPSRIPDSGTAGRQLSGNLFAKVGGAARNAAYGADKQSQGLRFADRPAGAQEVSDFLLRHKNLFSAGAVATSHQSDN